MDLPNAVLKALNENGEVEITKIIKSLVFNPKEIPHLIQLGQYFQLAKKTLSSVAKKLPEVLAFR
jgi:adenosylhomocysteine nucleosidase